MTDDLITEATEVGGSTEKGLYPAMVTEGSTVVEYNIQEYGDAFAKVIVEQMPALTGSEILHSVQLQPFHDQPVSEEEDVDVVGDSFTEEEGRGGNVTVSGSDFVYSADNSMSSFVDTPDNMGEDSLGSFAGIEATDVSSLLAQFEEASASFNGSTIDDDKNPGLSLGLQSNSSNDSVPTPPSTPPVDGKNPRLAMKRKSAIMIPMLVPAKRERGKAIELSWGNTSKKLQRIMLQQEAEKESSAAENVQALTPPCSQEQSSSESTSTCENQAPVLDDVTNDKKTVCLSPSYFDSIVDHDYCQNFPTQLLSDRRAQISGNGNDADKVDPKSTENQGVTPVEEDVGEEFGSGRFSKFATERNDIGRTSEIVKASSFRDVENSKFSRQKRNYRNNNNNNDKTDAAPVFDKLPQYFTVLTKPKLDRREKSGKVEICLDEESKDREGSPTRETLFDKLPAYYSCFTNSTKYDGSEMPPLSTDISLKDDKSEEDGELMDTDISREEKGIDDGESKYPWDRLRDINVSAQSSRSQTPLVIDSRSGTPALSRPQSRSRSRSPSNSGGSPLRRSRRRSHSPRRRSYSSDSHSSSSRSSRSRSRSASCSRSRSPSYPRSTSRRSRKRSRSRSRTSSRSRSHSRRSLRYRRSRSPLSRSRSRSRSQRRSRHSRSRSRRRHSRRRSRSSSYEEWYAREREKKKEQREQEKKKQIEERRIIYVGKIPDNYTRRDLRRRFDRFGPIEQVGIHFREESDNYGFVTFAYTCDAYAAIEKGNRIKGEPIFDLCFGGRREFCKSSYADLDGNKEIEEEHVPFSGLSNGSLDFDSLLKQAKTAIKQKKK